MDVSGVFSLKSDDLVLLLPPPPLEALLVRTALNRDPPESFGVGGAIFDR